jgi:glutamine synthetase
MTPTLFEYIWLDAQGISRSKIRTHWDRDAMFSALEGLTFPLDFESLADDHPIRSIITEWNFDGSSTGQNTTDSTDTEVMLYPVKVYKSPYGLIPTSTQCHLTYEETYLVLCDLGHTSAEDKEDPSTMTPGFTRQWASQVSNDLSKLDSWFGLEQEYFLLDSNYLPLDAKDPQGPYYCAVQYPYNQLSQMVREHYAICLKAGLKIAGINAEVAPSQWEFQIGPGPLVQVADDLVLARYFLYRLSTSYGVRVSFHPKPLVGDWNGSGCHLNFSTADMRDPKTGCTAIEQVIKNLEAHHTDILEFYGEDNDKRLTGLHETSSMTKFSWGVGTRHTSVRIPNAVNKAGCGYIEDRRPAANIDPYLAMGKFLLCAMDKNDSL